MTLPAIRSRIRSKSSATGSRSNRSSTRNLRTWLTDAGLLINSLMGGRILKSTLHSRHLAMILSTTCPLARGMAIITQPTLYLRDQLVQRIGVAQNFDAVDLDAFLAEIVVHKAHRVIVRGSDSVSTPARWLLPAISGADDQSVALRPVAAGAFGVGAHREAGAAQHHDGQKHVDEHNRPGISRQAQDAFHQAKNKQEPTKDALLMSSRSLMPT